MNYLHIVRVLKIVSLLNMLYVVLSLYSCCFVIHCGR